MIEEAISGDRKALARLMTEIEHGNEEISDNLLSKIRGARVIGITGYTGSGKSTIISKLAMRLIREGKKVGILCIDPSSPVSGGSLLGDRIRMPELSRHPEAFIRSIPTGGKKGGLGYFTVDLINAMDAAGYDYIFIETVGSGQDETDIRNIADTVVMVMVPNLGDDVQVIKAGIMEVADIFVVNKADTGSADEKVRELLLILNRGHAGWVPQVVKTVAINDVGTDELMSAIYSHLLLRESSRAARIIARLKLLVRYHVEYRLDRYFMSQEFDSKVNELLSGKSLNEVVSRTLGELIK